MTDSTFAGFLQPEQNWSPLPHEFIESMGLIETLAEMKVIVYILRHTWGFKEFDKPKRITLDEFEHGRKRKDGTRIDDGVGMSRPSIINGLARACEHGFLTVEVDESDAARVKKSYMIAMRADSSVRAETQEIGVKELYPRGKETLPQGLNSFTPDEQPEVKELYPSGKETLPRSEKETIERNLKTKDPAAHAAAPDGDTASPAPTDDIIIHGINLSKASIPAILEALESQPEDHWRAVLFAEQHQAPYRGTPRKTLVKALEDQLNPTRKLQTGDEIELALDLAQVIAECAFGWNKPVGGSTKGRIMAAVKTILLDLEEAGDDPPTPDELRAAYSRHEVSPPRDAVKILGMLNQYRNGRTKGRDDDYYTREAKAVRKAGSGEGSGPDSGGDETVGYHVTAEEAKRLRDEWRPPDNDVFRRAALSGVR